MSTESKATPSAAPSTATPTPTPTTAPTSTPASAPNPYGDHPDRPLCVININESGDQFEFDEANTKVILDRAKAINPNKIVIVSVVGAFRTGKSFLLDFFLRYLHFGETAPPHELDENGIPKWMTKEGDMLVEGNYGMAEKGIPGFLWRGGRERTTTGIWMYGRPFVKTLPKTGEKVAVILMDTQGMFDLKTSSNLTAAIFGLSTLISSYQIYNIVKQIQEDKLEQLDYFTQFSLVALKELEKSQKRSKTPQDLKDVHPFQTIDFLVRDWQNFGNDEDIKACLNEMPVVLDEAMRTHADDNKTREQIKAAFESIKCFLLTHPGIGTTKPNYSGKISEIEKSFLKLLDEYIRQIFEQNICTKKVHGREVSPADLLQYLKTYAEIFKTGNMPKAVTLVEAISTTTNLLAKDHAFTKYKLDMHQAINRTSSALTDDEFAKAHKDAYNAATKYYDDMATFGDETQIKQGREELIKMIGEEYHRAEKENKRKLQGNLAFYVIPCLVAVSAFILDFVSDYTCDSWSKTCRQFSRLFAFIYYVVGGIVGYEVYRIYKSKGSASAGLGVLALSQATIEKGQEFSRSISQHSVKTMNPEKPKKD